MRTHLAVLVAGAVACLGTHLVAQGIPVAQSDTVMDDGHILGVRAVVDQQEIEAARWAAAHTRSAAVKQFTRSLLRGHGNAQNTAAALADRLRIERHVPADTNTAIVERHRALMSDLHTLKGAAFDRRFLEGVRDEHASEIAKVNTWYGPAAKQDSVKAYLVAIMPTLTRHRDTAEKLLGAKTVASK